MSLAGGALFLGWHDVAGEDYEDFHEWHDREHVPERMAVPGFLYVRRYRAFKDGPQFLNVMELAGPDVLQSAEYRELAANPTEWTQRILPIFRGLSRGVFFVSTSLGEADGAFLLLARDVEAPADAARVLRHLEDIHRLPEIVGVHHCQPETGEMSASVLLIEASTPVAAASAGDALVSDRHSRIFSVAGPLHVYQLETAHRRR